MSFFENRVNICLNLMGKSLLNLLVEAMFQAEVCRQVHGVTVLLTRWHYDVFREATAQIDGDLYQIRSHSYFLFILNLIVSNFV